MVIQALRNYLEISLHGEEFNIEEIILAQLMGSWT